MEWLIVILIGVILFGTAGIVSWLHQRTRSVQGMSAKDIGEIADQMWNEWKGKS
jgi:hypothetical protein